MKCPKLLVFVIAVVVFSLCVMTTDATGGDAKGENERNTQSFMSLIIKGGVVMIPLGICSIIALTLGLEGSIKLRRKKVIPPDFLTGLEKHLEVGDLDLSKGVEYCKQKHCPFGNILQAGIMKLKSGVDHVKMAIEEAAAYEVRKMKRGLRGLSIIARISPLLGLLGTVYGMIGAFQNVAMGSGSIGKAETLASGIYEALVTTATGLTVAIPTLLVFYFLNNRVDMYAEEMEDMGNQFLNHYCETLPVEMDRKP